MNAYLVKEHEVVYKLQPILYILFIIQLKCDYKMALVGKLETTVDIKSSAEKFFNFLSSECHVLPNVASDKVKGVDIREGEWHASGSVKHWKFNIGML